MSNERKMTIARGLTRLKTIKAQLVNISQQVTQYGAISNKVRHPLGGQRVSLEKNHSEAIAVVESLYQQFNDLTSEFMRIKLAIDKANLTTIVEIGGKSLTIQEALIYRRDIQSYVQSLSNGYGRAVQQAQNTVDKYNASQSTEGLDENTIKAVMADVLYLVPLNRVQEANKFIVEFMTELDGTLNEVNALTEIEI